MPGNEDATGFVKSLIEKRSANWSVAELDWAMARNAGIGPLYTGKQISVESSMQCVAVYACVRILAETIASLPIPVYKRLQPRGKERDRSHPLYSILNEQPNPDMTAFSLRECQMGQLNLWGNAYQEIEYDSGGVDVKALWPLRPDRMAIKRNDQGRLFYEYTLPSGEKKTFGKMQIHHVHGLSSNGIVGISPISYAREAIGMALAAEEYSGRFFGNDSTPGGILTHPGKLKPEGKVNLKESWEAAHSPLSNKHRVAVLEEGVTWTQIGIPPRDAQFLEMRKFQITEIARLFRIPLHMLADLDRATFSNIEHQSLEFVIHTIRPWMKRLEQAIHADLFTPKEREAWFAEFLVEDILRGDIKRRYEAYAIGISNGWLYADQIREFENMNPMPAQEKPAPPPTPQPAKELPPPEEPEKKSIEPEEVRARWSGSAASRRRLAKSYERLFSDATLRLVKREEAEIMRAADKYLERRDSQSMSLYLDDFYRDFAPVVVKAMQPIVASLADVASADALAEINVEDDVDPEMEPFAREYSEIMARDYVESSLSQLKNVMAIAATPMAAPAGGAMPPMVNPVDALRARFSEWRENRPAKVAEKESREVTNSVTRRKWLRKGVTKLRWVTAGDSCPFCKGLNGRIVGIDKVFLSAGEEFQPEGAAQAFKPSRKVSYPPIHKGCACGISAVTETTTKVIEPSKPLSVGGVRVSGEAETLYNEMPDSLRRAASESGLKEVRFISEKEMEALVGRGGVVRGLYEENGRLSLVRGFDDNATKGLMHHEMAHAMDPLGKDGKFKISQSREWLEAGNWKQDKKGNWTRKDTMDDKPTSEYGKTSPWEDFAESYKMMMTGDKYDRMAMKVESSKRYAFMEQFLKERGYEIK